MGTVTNDLGCPHCCVFMLSWPSIGERIYLRCTLSYRITVQYPAIVVFKVDLSQGFYDPLLNQKCEQLGSTLQVNLNYDQCVGYPQTL